MKRLDDSETFYHLHGFILSPVNIFRSIGSIVKAILVTREPPEGAEEVVKVIKLPFVDEDILYVVDNKTGFMEVRGREEIMKFISAMKGARRIAQ